MSGQRARYLRRALPRIRARYKPRYILEWPTLTPEQVRDVQARFEAAMRKHEFMRTAARWSGI